MIEIENIYEYVVPNDYNDCNVKKLEYKNLKYNSFFEKFMLRNLPCIIKNVSSAWNCSNTWIKSDTIDCSYFIDEYGDLEAPVADCDNVTYNSECKNNMKIRDYMLYLCDSKNKVLYLKDWHLRRIRPDDAFYRVPFLFASDWLNEYAQDHQEDDFMFVYIGPKRSWTPLHVDVYYSYSWSVNVVGRKKWYLFPPGEEEKLKDSLGNLPLLFKPEICNNVNYIEIIQEKGDAIFVPSGWHHQVHNLLDTISVNHNWINACNIGAIWEAMEKSLSSVENEIKEFRDTPEFTLQCQLILKSLFGMDYATFMNFLCYIAKKRLSQYKGTCCIGFDNYILGKNHIRFDLNIILKILNIIHNHPLFSNINILSNIKYDFINIRNSIIKINKK